MSLRILQVFWLVAVLLIPSVSQAESPDEREARIEAELNQLMEEALPFLRVEEAMAERGGTELEPGDDPPIMEGMDGAEKAFCYPSSSFYSPAMCINGRFVVVALWENQYAAPGVLIQALSIQLTPTAGYFWFFDPYNMEIPFKMVNGCYSSPSRHWVFAAGLTNFGVGIGVKDLYSGIQLNYINRAGDIFNTIIDQQTPWPCP